MALGQHKRAVGAFSNYRDTELALIELQSTGFPMNKVSVVGENLDSNEIAGASAGKGTDEKVGGGAKAGATAGVVTGGLIGLLGSIGALAIPGVGPVMAGGALETLLQILRSEARLGLQQAVWSAVWSVWEFLKEKLKLIAIASRAENIWYS